MFSVYSKLTPRHEMGSPASFSRQAHSLFLLGDTVAMTPVLIFNCVINDNLAAAWGECRLHILLFFVMK